MYVQSKRERFYSTWENHKRLHNKSLNIQASNRLNKKRHHWGSLSPCQDEFTKKSTPQYIGSANLCESSIKLPTYGNKLWRKITMATNDSIVNMEENNPCIHLIQTQSMHLCIPYWIYLPSHFAYLFHLIVILYHLNLTGLTGTVSESG